MVDATIDVIYRGGLECDQNYMIEGQTEWFDSIQRIKAIERRHDAEVVYGHDTDQFSEIEEGWG